jgi:hypothetical protein
MCNVISLEVDILVINYDLWLEKWTNPCDEGIGFTHQDVQILECFLVNIIRDLQLQFVRDALQK